jgi:hypothetical protein
MIEDFIDFKAKAVRWESKSPVHWLIANTCIIALFILATIGIVFDLLFGILYKIIFLPILIILGVDDLDLKEMSRWQRFIYNLEH